MYFWRIEKLKSDWKSAPLSDRQVLPYLLFYLVCGELLFLIPSSTMNFWDYANVLCSAVLVLLGTLYVYRLNGGDKGAYFLQRYISLGWVVGIRLIAFALPLFIVLLIALQLTDESNGFGLGYVLFIEIALYQRLGKHIRDVVVA